MSGDRGPGQFVFEAVLLAAGSASRFGGGKLRAPWGDGLVLHASLAAAFAAPVGRVRVVWGSDAAVPALAGAWAEAHGEARRLILIEAERHADGLSASLKAGLVGPPDDCAGLFVFLADMPRVPHAILAPLARAVAEGAAAAAPVFAGQRGHPVVLGAGLLAAVASLSGDRGAGGLLQSLGEGLALIPAPDDGVIYDIDRPEDLGRP